MPATAKPSAIIRRMKFLRLMPGRGELVLAEGDPELSEDEERLVEEFRRQLDSGMWAAVPTTDGSSGRREAVMVRDYAEIPRGTERVIFFPRAAGG
jgi:hypothetical protein